MNPEPSARSDSPRLPRNVKILGLASLLNDIASEMIYPLMPAFLISVLGGNRFHLGIIEGVADSVSSLLRLLSGAWSDRPGWRKGFVVLGYGLAAVSRPLAGIAGAPWHLFLARTADRIGKGVRTAPRDALIADSTDATIRGRAFGFHQAMDHLGAAIGPVLATLFLLAWPGQLRLLFLLSVIPGLVVVVLLALGLKEVRSTQPPTTGRRLTLAPFGWEFRVYLAALVLFTLGNSSDAFLLVRAAELGVSQAYLPLLWCAFHVVKSNANLAAGAATDRLGPRPLLVAGWLAYGLAYLAFAAATSLWQVVVLFLLYGFVYSLTEPAMKSMVTMLTPPDRKGLAFGWFNFAIGIAALPSSMLCGWLYERFGAPAAFGWGAALAAVAALVVLSIRREGQPSRTSRSEH